MHQRRIYYVIVATSQTFLLLILLAMVGVTSDSLPVVLPVHLATRFATHSDQSDHFDHLVTDSLVIKFSVALLNPIDMSHIL